MASVTKRRWKKPDGTQGEAWAVRYFDAKGARRSKTFALKKEAEAFKRKTEREIHEGTHTPDSDAARVSEACRDFVLHTEQRARDGRIGRGRAYILSLSAGTLSEAHGGIRFKDLTPAMIDALYRGMTAKGMAPVTARERVRDMKQIEDFAVRRGLTKTRPVSEALRDLRGIPREPIRTFTVEELVALLKAASIRPLRGCFFDHARFNCIVNIAAFCGLRRGEILALDLDHIDVERRLISVERSLTHWRELKGPKTRAGVRVVPMPVHVAEMLRAWVADFYVDNPDRLLFTSKTGQTTLVGSFHTSWTRLLKRAGMHHEDRPFHFHALRHFCASWMIETGAPLTDTANLLGHRKFDITLQTYAHSVTKPHLRNELVDRMVARLPAPTHQ